MGGNFMWGIIALIVLSLFGIIIFLQAERLRFQRVYQRWLFFACAIHVVNATVWLGQRTERLQAQDTYSKTAYIQAYIHDGRFSYENTIEPGDILLYRKLRNRNTEFIRFLERIENGPQVREYYHVAIALDSHSKIEANGNKVCIVPIGYGSFDIFRPPIPPEQRDAALDVIKGLAGEPYDWSLVIDDVLRCLTLNLVHLPVALVQAEELHKKTCTSLVVDYLWVAKWGKTWNLNVSPEDIYFLVKNYPVSMN
jgi:hypothetical protein